MTNILFIALEFPPQAQTGVYRSLKFAKYLPQFGINPIILTIDLFGSTLKEKNKFDFSLLNELPSSTKVYRLPLKDITKGYSTSLKTFFTIYFRIYDEFFNALKDNLNNTVDIIFKEHQPKLIYVSLPPFSSAKVALNIQNNYKVPLVVDMRDGWSQWCIGPFGSWFHYYLTKMAERRLFQKADKIITVTDELKSIFLKVHPGINKDKFNVINNSFDNPYKIDNSPVVNNLAKDKFIIGYIGRFYYSPAQRIMMFSPWWKKRLHRIFQYSPVKEDWLYRSPYFFLKTLRSLFVTYPALRTKVFFAFVGEKENWLDNMIEEFGLQANFINYGYVNQVELPKIISKFDAFLSTSVKVLGGEDYALASKSFDYILYNKPILGFVCNGAQKKFLEATGLGLICDPDDENASLEFLYSLVSGEINVKPNRDFIASFNSQTKTSELSSVINKILTNE